MVVKVTARRRSSQNVERQTLDASSHLLAATVPGDVGRRRGTLPRLFGAMDKFVRVYSGGELMKGPNGVEFGDLSEQGIWFKAAPTYSELIDAVYKKLGLEPTTHDLRAQGRTNVGGGAHRHFIMVPIDDDMSWSQPGQYQCGSSGTVDTTSYLLIGLYDEVHRAHALASGQHLTELNPRNREPLRFDKRYERYLRPAGLMGLANICRAGLPSIDRALVSALVDRWRPETHTFHMPCGEITITLQDVAMILGLPISGHAVIVNKTESYIELYQRYLGKAPPSDKSRPGLRVAWVRAEFNKCPEDADEETVKQHARAYILSLVGGLLFPDASGDRYTVYPFPLIADLENIGSYSWGSATLAYLYRAMCDACRRQSDQSNLTGCLLLLQPDMLKPKFPNVDELEDDRDRPTVGLRWVVGACTYRSAPARCYEHFTNEFDLLTDDQVVWSPYRQDRVKTLHLAPICTQDSHLWLTQAPLVFFFMVEVYTPERVMRQFGLHQECPPPFRDTSVELHWCCRGKVRSDWADKHKSFVDMWEVKEQHVIMEERPYDHTNYMDYLRWYRPVTRIRLCTPRVSNGHQDGASVRSATADDEDSLRASKLRYTPRAHLIHSVTDKLTILAKEAASQKGCSRGECNAFIERVTRTCVELVGELGGSSLCDIAAAVPDSTTIAAERGSDGQRDTEDELNNSMVPDQENEWALFLRSGLGSRLIIHKWTAQSIQGHQARGRGSDQLEDETCLSYVSVA
ncbi:hypothetical protein ZWY2020_032281 [Hordeum vulgare]|nr:hypothetical protein ZWY2020_032281 [Hordeum vulgare]